MVCTSCGSSILFTASIFFGLADNPLSLQVCPKKETFGSLNCVLSGFNVKLFCKLPKSSGDFYHVHDQFFHI